MKTPPEPAREARRDAVASAACALLGTPLAAGLLSGMHLVRRALAPGGLPRPLLAQLRLLPHAAGLGLCAYGAWLALRAARARPRDPDPSLKRWRRFGLFALLMNLGIASWIAFTAYMIYQLTLRP